MESMPIVLESVSGEQLLRLESSAGSFNVAE